MTKATTVFKKSTFQNKNPMYMHKEAKFDLDVKAA